MMANEMHIDFHMSCLSASQVYAWNYNRTIKRWLPSDVSHTACHLPHDIDVLWCLRSVKQHASHHGSQHTMTKKASIGWEAN
jgi:hypothetical protein